MHAPIAAGTLLSLLLAVVCSANTLPLVSVVYTTHAETVALEASHLSRSYMFRPLTDFTASPPTEVALLYRSNVTMHAVTFDRDSGSWRKNGSEVALHTAEGIDETFSDARTWNMPARQYHEVVRINDSVVMMSRTADGKLLFTTFDLKTYSWRQVVTTTGDTNDNAGYGHAMYASNFRLLVLRQQLVIVHRHAGGVRVILVTNATSGATVTLASFHANYFSLVEGWDTESCYKSFRVVADDLSGAVHVLGHCKNSFHAQRYFFFEDRGWKSYESFARTLAYVPYVEWMSAVVHDGDLHFGVFQDSGYLVCRFRIRQCNEHNKVTKDNGFSQNWIVSSMRLHSLTSGGTSRLVLVAREQSGLYVCDYNTTTSTVRSNQCIIVKWALAPNTVEKQTACTQSFHQTSDHRTNKVIVSRRCGDGTRATMLQYNFGGSNASSMDSPRTRSRSPTASTTKSREASLSSSPSVSVAGTNSAVPSPSRSLHTMSHTRADDLYSESSTRTAVITGPDWSTTSSRSLMMTNETLVPPATSAPTQAPQPRKDSAAIVSIFISNPQAAEAVVATSTASAVVTSIISPTAGAQIARVGAVVRVAYCRIDGSGGSVSVGGAADYDDAPSSLEHPIQPTVGGGNFARTAGAALSTAVLVAVPTLALEASYRYSNTVAAVPDGKAPLGLRFSSVLTVISLSYFGPGLAGVASTLLLNRATSAIERFLGGLALAIVIADLALLAYHITGERFRCKVHLAGRKFNFSSDDPRFPHYVAGFANFFDSSREPHRTVSRIFFVEDVVSASAMAFIAGLEGSTRAGCVAIASAVSLVVILHVAYLAAVRPYARKLDAFFTGVMSTLNLAMCAAAVYSVASTSQSESTQRVIALVLILQSSLFFVQAIVQFAWYMVVVARRRRMDSVGLTTAALNVPLVSVDDTSTTTRTSSGDAESKSDDTAVANPLKFS